MQYTARSSRQYRKAGSWNHQTYRGARTYSNGNRENYRSHRRIPADRFDDATNDIYRRAMGEEVKNHDRKISISFVETKEYTAGGAWAHIHPWMCEMCILPPELRDPYLPIFDHEGLHVVYRGTEPNRDRHEDFVTTYAHNPSSKIELGRVRFVRR